MKSTLPHCVAFCLVIAASSLAQTRERPSEIRVWVADAAALQTLIALDIDLLPHEPQPGWVHAAIYGQGEDAALASAGFRFEIVWSDLVAHLQQGLSSPTDAFPAIGSGSMGGYFTWNEMVAAFDSLQATFPNLVAPKVSLGTSWQGRQLWMWKISDNPLVDEPEPEIELDGIHHAREPGTMTNMYYFLTQVLSGYGTNDEFTSLIDNREIYCVPCVNPDGYVYNETTTPGGGGMWRKNRRDNGNGTFGVDPNRNYGFQWGYLNQGSSSATNSETYRGPAPFSEPETQAMQAFGQSRSFSIAQNSHTYGGFHLYPFGYIANVISPLQASYVEWALRMSAVTGYRSGTPPEILYTASGVSTDWWEGVMGVPAFTTEMGSQNDGFWPPTSRILPLAQENFLTWYEFCWIGGSHVVVKSASPVQVVGMGNGNGNLDPGEQFDVMITIRNVGRIATGGPVSIFANSATPYTSMISASGTTAAPIASVSDATIPVRIQISPSAPQGAPLSLTVTTIFDGIPRTETVNLVCGTPSTIVNDNFETVTGWTVGSPQDSGTGAWTRVNPNGTGLALLLGGTTPWQPEDDHSPSGTTCYVTGQGSIGASVNSADVDGTTTLTSPTYDLSNLLVPTMQFWIWFANDDQDDGCAIELSNDNGTTWVAIETVRGWRNAWTQHTIRVGDWLVPTSQTRIRFRVADLPSNSATEAGLDDFTITGFPTALAIGLGAVGGPGGVINFSLANPAGAGQTYVLGFAESATTGIPLGDGRIAGVDDTPILALVGQLPSVFVDFIGTLNPSGGASPYIVVPNVAALSGIRFYAAAVSIDLNLPFPIRDITNTTTFLIP